MEPRKIYRLSLREKAKNRLLKDMIFTVKTKYPKIKCFILVLDKETTKIISAVIKIVELLEEGITTIEKLELKRKCFPNVHAIYFISGT
jgi:syntaxin-binding protein 1